MPLGKGISQRGTRSAKLPQRIFIHGILFYRIRDNYRQSKKQYGPHHHKPGKETHGQHPQQGTNMDDQTPNQAHPGQDTKRKQRYVTYLHNSLVPNQSAETTHLADFLLSIFAWKKPWRIKFQYIQLQWIDKTPLFLKRSSMLSLGIPSEQSPAVRKLYQDR